MATPLEPTKTSQGLWLLNDTPPDYVGDLLTENFQTIDTLLTERADTPTTNGTAEASKALVLDSEGNINFPLGMDLKVRGESLFAKVDAVKINRVTNLPIDTTGTYRNAKFLGATIPCVTPTSYAINDQCLHPSVVYIPGGWNGHRHWGVYTPFPENDDAGKGAVENPEIVYSDDGGQTWQVPAGLTNPIDTPASGYLQNDTHLWFENNTLYCFYGHLKSDSSLEEIRVKHSTDGVTWSDRVVLFPGNTGKNCACPIIEKVGSTYYMWTASFPTGPGTGTMYLRTSSSLLSGWSAPVVCNFNGTAATTHYWHGDIKWIGDRFLLIGMFIDSAYANSVLLHGTSFDGLAWNIEKHSPQLQLGDGGTYCGTTGSWDAAVSSKYVMYRPCFIWYPEEKKCDVWYSINHASNSQIGKGEMFITPSQAYSLDNVDRLSVLLGAIKGFWPGLDRAGTVISDYSVLANHLTASGTYGLGSWYETPIFKSPIHAYRMRGEVLSRADDADFTFGDASADSAFSAGCWLYRPSQVNIITIAGTWAAADTATVGIGAATVTYTCTDNDAAKVVTGLVAAWNASTNATLSKFDAYDGPGNTFFLVSNTRANTQTIVASEVTAGNGTCTSSAATNFGASDIINKYSQDSTSQKEWRLCTESGKLTVRLYDDSANAFIGRMYNTAISADTWHYVVFTYDATEASSGIKIYLDGVQVDDTDSASGSYTAMEDKGQALQIGYCIIAGAAQYGHYVGDIAMPFVTAQELTAAAIAQTYRIGQGLLQLTAR